MLMIGAGSIHAQINTTAGTVTSCPGEIQVPVNVTNCNGIGAISLVLNYNNTYLTYLGYQNLNAALSTGLLIVHSTGSQVIISWANTTAANIGNGTLMQLRFTAASSTSTLAWDTQTPGNCEYSDVIGNVLPATFTNGTANINQPPVINTQPASQTTLVGQNVNFSVSASGTGIAYLWQISINNGTSWSDLTNVAPYSGVTSSNMTITNTPLAYNGYKYRCRLTGTCTPVVYTNEVTLSVINPITTTLPTASFCPGSIVVPVTVTNFNGVASFSLTFSYNSSCLTYTGFQNLNGALSGGTFVLNPSGGKVYMTWTSTTAASFGNGTIAELLFTSATGSSSLTWDLATEGNCEYSALGGTLFTGVFVNGSETIYALPSIVSNPVSVIIAKGQNTSFSISASGSGLSYLWQVSTNAGGSWANLTNTGNYTNVTNATMNISNAQLSMSSYQYRCRVTGTCLPVVYSNAAVLTVLPNIITACGTVTGCPGQIIIPVNVTDFIGVASFSLTLNFNPAVLTYTGYQNLNVNVSGGIFTANVSAGSVYLTWSNTTAATIASGGLLIELKFTGTPGASTLTWDTQTPGNCEYSDLSGLVIFSTWTNGNATINTPPSIIADPVNKTIYAGGSTSFSVSASGTGLGYLWQVTTNGGLNWSNLTNVTPYSGVTSSTLTINPASTGMNGYSYHCIVSGTCTPSVTSNDAQLTVTQAAITTTPGVVTNSCTGNLIIPVNVTNCSNVGGISLTMIFDTTKMTFEGYQGTNAALAAGMLVVNRTANKVFLSWASATAANIGSGVLIQFRFRAAAGISTSLSWDTQTAGACEYSDPAGTIITSFYNTSTLSVVANALIVNAGSDLILTSGSVQINASATGGTPPYTWSWTPSYWLDNPAIANPVASPPTTTAYILTVNTTGCSGSDVVNVIFPSDISVKDITIGSGQNNCFNATQTITVAGGGASFVVQSGGSVNMIAGQMISYLPGTTVNPGGYLHGYITTSGQYCSSLPAAPVAMVVEETQPSPPDESFFRVYPNPTSGNFILELSQDCETIPVKAELVGIHGEKIASETFTGSRTHPFSLTTIPVGIYLIRITCGKNSGTKKIVKF